MGEIVSKVIRGPERTCSFCEHLIPQDERRVFVEHFDKYLSSQRFQFFHVDCSDVHVDKVFGEIVRHWKKTGSPFAVA